MIKPTEEQIKSWQEKHGVGNLRELTADGKSCIIYDPINDLSKMKALIGARSKGLRTMVDSILNNCWLFGDEELKNDDAFKQGIEEQVDKMIDIPEPEVEELDNGHMKVTVEGLSIEVRKATRMDCAFADDRNPDRKPLMSSIHLLERIAVDQQQLAALRAKSKAYIGVLMSVHDLKQKKHVEVKKF